LKEAINNLVKYSNAANAEIEVRYEEGCLEIFIRDDGKGFDQSKTYTGNGLLGMKNRAENMGAELIIRSTPGIGSTIWLTLKIK
jgi:signal transduction histidine kinase